MNVCVGGCKKLVFSPTQDPNVPSEVRLRSSLPTRKAEDVTPSRHRSRLMSHGQARWCSQLKLGS